MPRIHTFRPARLLVALVVGLALAAAPTAASARDADGGTRDGGGVTVVAPEQGDAGGDAGDASAPAATEEQQGGDDEGDDAVAPAPWKIGLDPGIVVAMNIGCGGGC